MTAAPAYATVATAAAAPPAANRHPERLGLVSDLLREFRSYPRLRALLACRRFDVDNDRALRAVTHEHHAAVVGVGNLDEEQIRQVLTDAGLVTAVPAPLMRLLAVPLHLALYVELALAGVSDLASARTLTQLYDRYWNVKRDACRLTRGGTDEWLPVIERLVERMNDLQELSVPEPVVDDLDQQVKIMASEGVLTVGQGRVTFVHETFLTTASPRHILASGDSLRALLARSEQDLFRRAQVRQILAFERGADVTAYLADLGWLLSSSDARLHIKALVVALLDTVPNPTSQEWQLLRPLAADPQSPLHLRLWQAVRHNPGWFPVLDADGTWATFLRAGDELADRAIWALTGCAADHTARVRELLADSPPEVWPSRRAAPPRQKSSRPTPKPISHSPRSWTRPSSWRPARSSASHPGTCELVASASAPEKLRQQPLVACRSASSWTHQPASSGVAIYAPALQFPLRRIGQSVTSQRAGDDGLAGRCGPRSRSGRSSRMSAVGALVWCRGRGDRWGRAPVRQ